MDNFFKACGGGCTVCCPYLPHGQGNHGYDLSGGLGGLHLRTLVRREGSRLQDICREMALNL